MRIERQHSDARLYDVEILFQGIIEDFKFLHDGIFCYRLRHLSQRQVGGDQRHAQMVVEKNHQRLVALADARLQKLRVTRKMEIVALD